MTGSAGWPEPTSPAQHLRQLDRRITIQERRAAATSAADLVGPGIAARAIQLYDWNDATATFNGFFYSLTGARHAPETNKEWNGSVTARVDGSGTQQLVNPQGTAINLSYVRTFKPHPSDPDVIMWGPWKKFATQTGFIDYPELNPGTVVIDIETALEDAAAAITFTESAIRVFRQTTAPVPGVGGAPATFKEGWIWFDTDDSMHMRIWKTATSTWVEPDYGMTAAQAAALAAAQADATAALANAASAFALAAAANTVYRQAADPDILNTIHDQDIWFETDNENRMWIWSSGAWIDPASLLVNTVVRAPANAGTGTSPTVIPGIALGPVGLSLWNNLGTTVFLNGSTGAALFKGSITSGSDIAGTTVTGGTVQSESTAARGVKMTSAGLIGYNTSGVATFSLLANGDLTVKGSILSGSTIAGAVITGTLETEVTASRGIKLTSAGMSAYNTSGTLTMQFLSATGTFYALGGLISGGDVNGATVTGGTVQSEVTAARGIKLSSTGLVAYNSVGTVTFVLDASTGTVTMAGSVLTGGTITGATFQTGTTGDRIVMTNALAAQVQCVFGGGGTPGGIAIVGGPTVLLSSGIGSSANVAASIGLAGNASGIIGDITFNGVTYFNYGMIINDLSYMPADVPTTTASGWRYMMVNDSTKAVHRSAFFSSRRYKKEIRTLDALGEAVLGIEPVTFKYKKNTPIGQADPNSVHRGVIAEDLHEAGLGAWLAYDEQGRPNEVDYPMWSIAVQAAVRHVNTKFEEKFASLEQRLAAAGI